ncbi:MAG TPA: glutathione S-transferase family protein [Candidatus Polarisedimenticolia bacterium]|nr:glutathione S-transferase family protein [Candidatus Polarisedimenticolia bacterium]
MLTLYRMKHSTNCERVEMALAHKKLEARSIWVDPEDRAEVVKASGQELVPVLTDGDKPVIDSMEIVRWLEDRFPDRPRLYPTDPAKRAETLVFIDWFNRVWKRPPNELDDELQKPEKDRDQKRVARLGAAMAGSLDLFERLLTGREYLLGEFGAADVAAFPFVKYASIPVASEDEELFHFILRDFQQPGNNHPNVLAWIARMDKRPRLS